MREAHNSKLKTQNSKFKMREAHNSKLKTQNSKLKKWILQNSERAWKTLPHIIKA